MERTKKCCVVGICVLFMLFLVAWANVMADDTTRTQALDQEPYIAAQEDEGESGEWINKDDSEYEEGEETIEDLQKPPWESEEESSSEWPSEEEPPVDSDAEDS